MIESATGATFAAQKQESPDAKVSCPSGCCRIIKAYRYCPSSINSATFVENRSFQTVPKQKGAMNTQSRRHDIYPHRYIDVPRFLTNLSHEKMNIVKLFKRLNEFSSVRHINIARACLEEYMPCLQKGYSHIAI